MRLRTVGGGLAGGLQPRLFLVYIVLRMRLERDALLDVDYAVLNTVPGRRREVRWARPEHRPFRRGLRIFEYQEVGSTHLPMILFSFKFPPCFAFTSPAPINIDPTPLILQYRHSQIHEFSCLIGAFF